MIIPFDISPLNSHYDGEYSDRMKAWRRLAAHDKVNNLQAMLRFESVSSVLEVGCGTGAVLAEVARRGVGQQHFGVDISDPSEHADTEGTSVQLQRYDGDKLPFDDRSFDLVFASHVIEHVPDPRGFLAEMARVASHLIYLEVPCELTIRAGRRSLQPSVSTGHINFYTPESFLLLLQTSDLEVQSLKLFDHSLEVLQFDKSTAKGWIHKVLRQSAFLMNPVFASRVFTFHCGALCRLKSASASSSVSSVR